MSNNERELSLSRANALKEIAIADFAAKEKVLHGTHPASIANANYNKLKILHVLGGREEDWESPAWQMLNRITDVETLLKIFYLPKEECGAIEKVGETFRYAITPYYLSLVDSSNPNCPIKAQCFPSAAELNLSGNLDPMGEKTTNPAGSVTRRYPNKLIINSTNACPAFCRHCQRRRAHGEMDTATSKAKIEESIQYVRENPEIREILITGGDALCLSNIQLEKIFSSLREIPHVEILRIGTRAPVTLPQRIDEELAQMLRKYNVFVATHFNHAVELTPEAIKAVELLADNGVQVRNQMVLLNGINNDKYVVQKTNEELVKARVIPYYLFQPKKVQGTKHFYVSIDEGLEIMKHLEGHTSGMCRPTYIVNTEGGLGKVPLTPSQNLIKTDTGYKVTTWENKEVNIE